MARVVAIIQARMGSTRLPGKVMKQLCGKSILAHDVTRISQAKRADAIVIATTTEAADAAIVAEADALGVASFRGSEQDVLSRYYEAAKAHHADVVVRITSDCPLYDAALLDAMLARFETANVDYLSNCIERHYPRGLDTEIFTFAALEKAFYEAHLPHEREHVTPYLYQHPELFSVQSFVGEGDDFSHLRWTLDTDEDWQLVSRIYHALYAANPLFSTADILALIAREPEIATINAHIEQKKLA